MKKIYHLLLLMCLSAPSMAQSLSPFAISSSGGFFSAGGNSLSSTTGEMTMVETFSGGSYLLTQGFQQPDDFGVSVAELPSHNSSLVFPNPNNGSFSLMIRLENDAQVTMKIYDALGREVYFEKRSHVSGVNHYALQLSALIDGIYWMEIQAENQSQTTLKDTHKINIIH